MGVVGGGGGWGGGGWGGVVGGGGGGWRVGAKEPYLVWPMVGLRRVGGAVFHEKVVHRPRQGRRILSR